MRSLWPGAIPPNRGGRHLGFARALVYEMPHTLAALQVGALSEWRATLIVRESACLSVEHRRALDAEMCADVSALNGLGNKRIEAKAKSIAYRLDPPGGRGPRGAGTPGTLGVGPPGAGLDDLRDRAAADAPGRRGVRLPAPYRGHLRGRPRSRAGHGRHPRRTRHRPPRRRPGPGQCGVGHHR